MVGVAVPAGSLAHLGLVEDEQRRPELRDRIAAVDPADDERAVARTFTALRPDRGSESGEIVSSWNGAEAERGMDGVAGARACRVGAHSVSVGHHVGRYMRSGALTPSRPSPFAIT